MFFLNRTYLTNNTNENCTLLCSWRKYKEWIQKSELQSIGRLPSGMGSANTKTPSCTDVTSLHYSWHLHTIQLTKTSDNASLWRLLILEAGPAQPVKKGCSPAFWSLPKNDVKCEGKLTLLPSPSQSENYVDSGLCCKKWWVSSLMGQTSWKFGELKLGRGFSIQDGWATVSTASQLEPVLC